MLAGRLQKYGKLMWELKFLAVTSVLTSCAATVPAKPPAPPAASSSTTASSTVGNYRRVVRSGQTYYCIKEIPTGSRMVEETCLTQAQMDAERDKARNFTEGVQGIATLPPSPNSH